MKIILIGFMGAGKSSVAKALAVSLNLKAVEFDDLVLKESGKESIAEIFEKDGEIVFRQLEIDTARLVSDLDEVVISTGGGVVLNKIILDYLGSNGVIIYLDASFEEIEGRIRDVNSRPLFQDREKARKLYNFRKSLYEEYADERISTDGKSIDDVVLEILKKMENKYHE